MDKLDALLMKSENNNVIIDFSAPKSIDTVIYDFSEGAIIGICEKLQLTRSELLYRIAHELGHYHTGTFYYLCSPLAIKLQCEYRADKWMINELVPIVSFKKAIKNGYNEIWQLAEYFDAPEEVILRAAYIYKCKELL
jgi:Zn-dependent peptidase ImmA (M78 family)